MKTYIAILRGVNVGSARKVPMAELRDLFGRLAFENVRTYIQSGNIVFKTGSTDPAGLIGPLETAIRTQFGFEAPVLIRTPAELRQVVDANPFLQEAGIDAEKLHITFLAQTPEPTLLEKIRELSFPPDRFVVADREVYVYCPDSYGNTKINNTFFEKKLKVSATTRNLKTVRELIRMASETV